MPEPLAAPSPPSASAQRSTVSVRASVAAPWASLPTTSASREGGSPGRMGGRGDWAGCECVLHACVRVRVCVGGQLCRCTRGQGERAGGEGTRAPPRSTTMPCHPAAAAPLLPSRAADTATEQTTSATRTPAAAAGEPSLTRETTLVEVTSSPKGSPAAPRTSVRVRRGPAPPPRQGLTSLKLPSAAASHSSGSPSEGRCTLLSCGAVSASTGRLIAAAAAASASRCARLALAISSAERGTAKPPRPSAGAGGCGVGGGGDGAGGSDFELLPPITQEPTRLQRALWPLSLRTDWHLAWKEEKPALRWRPGTPPDNVGGKETLLGRPAAKL